MQIEITPEYLCSQGRYEKFPSKFWKKVHKTDSCWLWIGSKTKFGYGIIGVGENYNYANLGAHVASWVLHNGVVPNGFCVLHNCPGGDNPACVNPAHLWLGTKKQNTHDMMKKGRMVIGKRLRGELSKFSKLTNEKVLEIRRRHKLGQRYSMIAKHFGVSPENVSLICRRVYWRHLP